MSVDLPAGLAAAARALGIVGLRPIGEPLAGSPRTVVVRAATDDGLSVVVKVFDPDQSADGAARESAALSVLKGRMLPVPELLAEAADPPLIVLADLGTGPSVADRLRADDPAAATRSVLAWAAALGQLHRATADDGPAFAARLRSGTSGAGLAADSTVDMMTDGLTRLAGALGRIGLSLPDDAAALLAALPAAVGGPVGLTPADTCPDNNIETPNGSVLLDFESATVCPVAWDLAYLAVPWPSCWCAWSLPDTLASDALAQWSAAAGQTVSTVDIARAVIGWTFISTGWFLGAALDGAPAMGPPGRAGPPRRALLLHRLGLVTGALSTPLAAVSDIVDPALGALAAQIRATLVRDWGEAELPLPPALR